MKNSLKNAFDSIRAEDALKESTKAAVSKKLRETKIGNKTRFPYKRILATAMCVMVLCIGLLGYNLYFTPITVISVDVNPSIELGINRFDRVISVSAFNSEAKEIVSGLDVEHLNYKKAVEKLLTAEKDAGYTTDEEPVYITVFGDSDKRCDKMIDDIGKEASSDCAVEFCKGNKKNFDEAHNHGLSAGKYEAYLSLKESDPTVTIEEVKGLTMRQMKERGEKHDRPDEEGGNGEHGGNGAHHGESNGNGKGENLNDGDKGSGEHLNDDDKGNGKGERDDNAGNGKSSCTDRDI